MNADRVRRGSRSTLSRNRFSLQRAKGTAKASHPLSRAKKMEGKGEAWIWRIVAVRE